MNAPSDSREIIELGEIDPLLVVGTGDRNLRAIQQRLPVRLVLRDGAITVLGETQSVHEAARLVRSLVDQARRGRAAELLDGARSAASQRGERQGDQGGGSGSGSGARPAMAWHSAGAGAVRVGSNLVRPRSAGQAGYLEAIDTHDVVFCIGPAGTGKTFLAVAKAVAALNEERVDRILLVRPAVEAGESLGFLPGDFREKVDPYLRPLYDALGELMPTERMRKLIEVGVIEIAPLAYMRGRTLNRAFVILDEGQNTTVGQMKMFLTRLGPQSKAVITGDITQVDLADPQRSGLIQIQAVLAGIEPIAFVYLDGRDVVRHRLVRDIIRAFAEHDDRAHGNDRTQDGDLAPDGQESRPGGGLAGEDGADDDVPPADRRPAGGAEHPS
ncbi:MAG: PhoH family protein [Candidatus Eiseniibacteriota bacterium]